MKTGEILLTLLLSIALLTSACNNRYSNAGGNNEPKDVSTDSETPIPISDGHTSELSLDWFGVYKGILPCADCEGIKTRITLTKDHEFTRSMTYLGKEALPVMESGTFEWNSGGSRITLEAENGNTQSYSVGENVLIHLDQDGNVITGDNAEKYRLRQNASDWRIENKRWILTELMGTPVEIPKEGKEAWIKMDMETGTAIGNNGCNSFIIQYDLLRGNRISFSKGASTLMACPDMEINDAFMEALGKTDNYSLGEDGTLTFNKAKMAPLAHLKVAK